MTFFPHNTKQKSFNGVFVLRRCQHLCFTKSALGQIQIKMSRCTKKKKEVSICMTFEVIFGVGLSILAWWDIVPFQIVHACRRTQCPVFTADTSCFLHAFSRSCKMSFLLKIKHCYILMASTDHTVVYQSQQCISGRIMLLWLFFLLPFYWYAIVFIWFVLNDDYFIVLLDVFWIENTFLVRLKQDFRWCDF